jgi:cobaltochelatase CobN
MHLVFRESHGLEETEVPTDPGQSPADLVVLSYSDSDLGAFAAGWHRADGGLPGLRLCNISALRHPVSVDNYVETTLSGARAVLVRLIGGEAYWPYGVASLQDLARRRGIALAFLPADGRPDPVLERFSTLDAAALHRLSTLCDQGGAVAAQMALAELARAAGLPAAPVAGQAEIPDRGFYDPDAGVITNPATGANPVLVSFYRSYLTSADLGPVDAMIRALRAQGFAATGVFAPSLKAPGLAAWLAPHLPGLAAIVNMTAFSARDGAGTTPFDGADCPVFQVALSTAPRALWADGDRGLSAADLAMHVVLPEVDGRIFLGAVSFKAPQPRDPDLQFSRQIHAPDEDLTRAAVARVKAWHRLRAATRRAVILSTYPGKAHQLAHAVGLDALASCGEILGIAHDDLGRRLMVERLTWPLADYLRALAALPQILQDDLHAAWGDPQGDAPDGAFRFAAIREGHALIALQPERGEIATRSDDYHDLSRTPRHAYVAFYLWLRTQTDALIHMGAHGTLEWLPGKSVALSGACWPQVLTGDLPVIYPFIVNDPGEAAQAKRRLGAVTLGHLPPPLTDAAIPENLLHLERLLDEYSTADGLDPRRRDRLIGAIRDEARAAGVEADLGLPPNAAPAQAIPLIDRFLCDLKDSRFGVGLHGYGTGPCGTGERAQPFRRRSARRAVPRGARPGHQAGRGAFAPPSAGPWRLAARAGRRSVGQRHHAHGGRGIRHGPAPGRHGAALGRRVRAGQRRRYRDAGRAGPAKDRRDAAGLGAVSRRVSGPCAAVRDRGRRAGHPRRGSGRQPLSGARAPRFRPETRTLRAGHGRSGRDLHP